MNGVAGLNCRTLSVSRDMIVSAVRQLNCAFVLVQDDPDLIARLSSMGVKTIYRQSNDETLSLAPDAFVRERAKNAPSATFIHLSNELDPTPELLEWTLEGMKYADQQRLRLVIHNFSTGRTSAQWNAARANALYAAQHGHANGAHVYANNDGRPDAETFLGIKHTVGGVWLCTEFGFALDAYHGWRGTLSQEQYADFCRAWLPTFAAENMPVLLFSYDTWTANEAGKAHGFGVNDAPEFLKALAALNRQYPIKEQPTMPTTTPAPDGLSDPLSTTVSLASGLKLRKSVDTSADNAIRTMPAGERVTAYRAPLQLSTNVLYFMAYVEDAQGNSGYAAIKVGALESFTPAVAAVDEPPEADTVTYTAEEHAALIADYEALGKRIQEVDPANSGIPF